MKPTLRNRAGPRVQRFRKTLVFVLLCAVILAAGDQPPALSPNPATAEEGAESTRVDPDSTRTDSLDSGPSWAERRRRGAIALWAGLIVSSVIIGIVRSRQRRQRARRSTPPA